jgi:hypothetical protein
MEPLRRPDAVAASRAKCSWLRYAQPGKVCIISVAASVLGVVSTARAPYPDSGSVSATDRLSAVYHSIDLVETSLE